MLRRASRAQRRKRDGKRTGKRNIAAFEALDADYIITNAGGCGAFLQEYPHLLKDEPGWAERAEQFVRKLKDFSSVLVDLKFHQNLRAQSPHIVTYQDSCHLRNVMHTSEEPRTLLKSIKGAEYREMEK